MATRVDQDGEVETVKQDRIPLINVEEMDAQQARALRLNWSQE
jgi:hypothetical protein